MFLSCGGYNELFHQAFQDDQSYQHTQVWPTASAHLNPGMMVPSTYSERHSVSDHPCVETHHESIEAAFDKCSTERGICDLFATGRRRLKSTTNLSDLSTYNVRATSSAASYASICNRPSPLGWTTLDGHATIVFVNIDELSHIGILETRRRTRPHSGKVCYQDPPSTRYYPQPYI